MVNFRYEAQNQALKFLRSALRSEDSIALLYGPEDSGKTTTIGELRPLVSADAATAFVDGTRIKPQELLGQTLSQFGYETGLGSTDELVKMINVFAMQQARSNEPPVLVVDDADRMYPSALNTLNTLASLSAQGRHVLRVIATARSDHLRGVSGRQVRSHELGPLTQNETMAYLHSRLEAQGVAQPDTVMPMDVCDRIFEQSDGWPGRIEACAQQTLDPRPPSLVITRDGTTIGEFEFRDKKILIGRSDFADIVIDDEFASKLHAVMLLYSDALVLIDLNSSNGTTVNSVRVRSTVLKDKDIISLGHHRIKILNAPPISKELAEFLEKQDTIRMKNLVDLREARARLSLKTVNSGDAAGPQKPR